MSYPYGASYTVSAGDTILAIHYNTANSDHINNNIPESIDDYSADVTEMQATTDPYPASVASLATTLDGELQRIRYVIKQITGVAQWYIDPPGTMSSLPKLAITGNSPSPPAADTMYKESIIAGAIAFNGSTLAIRNSFNVLSITDLAGDGAYQINWDLVFSDANYVAVANSAALHTTVSSFATDSVNVHTYDSSHAVVNVADVTLIAINEP